MIENSKTYTLPEDATALKHSVSPYIGLPIVLLVLLPFLIYGAIQSNDWSGIEFMFPVILLMLGFIVWNGTRYKVWVTKDRVIRRTSDGFYTEIAFTEITKVEQEASNVQTLIGFRRPFRRVTVYGKDGFLDVSLKHFVLEDIRELLNKIRTVRPDLSIPSI